ncbi:MAG: DegV family protein, partial [Chloroflexota bacterium]
MTMIISDTTSGLSKKIANENGIILIPQQVIFENEVFTDDSLLQPDEFVEKLRKSTSIPKTAAPLFQLYFPYFSEAEKNNEPVLILCPTGKMSGTIRSAETARMEFPKLDIRIIDTQTIAGCLGSLSIIARRMVKQGRPIDDIESEINKLIPLSHTFFVVDTLEYLKKGGRIGAAKALLGELLQVKPILQIKDGMAAPYEQERTKKKAINRMVEIVCEQVNTHVEPHLCVMH